MLERTQKGSMDVTDRLACFLATLQQAAEQARQAQDAGLVKTRPGQRWTPPGAAPLNERRARLVSRLLEGFEGKLTSRKWAVIIAERSPDADLRAITDPMAHGILRKSSTGGRSTRHELNDPPTQDGGPLAWSCHSSAAPRSPARPERKADFL